MTQKQPLFQSCSPFSFLDTAAAAYILDASGAAAFIATASGATASGATASGATASGAVVPVATVPGAAEPSAAVPDAAVSGHRLSAVTFLLTWAKACWANWAFQSFHDQRDMMVVCGHRLSVESIVASNPLAIFSVAIVVAAVVQALTIVAALVQALAIVATVVKALAIAKLEAVVIKVVREVFFHILKVLAR